MPKKYRLPESYISTYLILLFTETILVIFILSPAGAPNGLMKDIYKSMKSRLDFNIFTMIILLVGFSFFFPGIGWLLLVVLLWRIAESCCNNQIESFGDGLSYGWGRYYPDVATFYDQGLIERDQDGTRAAYSSAHGDVKDIFRIKQLSDYENKIAHRTAEALQRKKLVYTTDNKIIPDIKDSYIINGKEKYLCDNISNINNECTVNEYGNIFEILNRPRPLYTTSTLAKEVGSA